MPNTQVQLAAGEQRNISLALRSREKSIWNVNKHRWEEVYGDFHVHVGASSTDLRLNGTLRNH